MADLRASKMSRRQFLVRGGQLGLAGVTLSALGAGATAASARTIAAPVRQAVTIKWAYIYDPAVVGHKLNIDWANKVIDEFQKANPDIKVETEQIKWDEIDQRSILDYQAGVPHDLMMSSPQLMAKHGEAGDYIDLGPMLKEWGEAELKDFNWSPVWTSGTVNGQVIGIPTGVHTRTVAFRRDWFQAAGLDPDNPPQTWESFLEAAKKLTTPDHYGLGMFFGSSRATVELYFAPFIWHFGGELWDPQTKKATFASEPGLKSAQLIVDLVKTHKVTPETAISGTYDDNILKAFLNGQVAMAFGYGSYWIGAMEDAGFLKGCFPASAECTPQQGDCMVTPTAPKAQFTNAWTLSIHKLSKAPEAAFKFLTWIMKPENLAGYPDAGLPGRLSLWDRPEYQSKFYKTWLEAAKNGRPMPPTVYYPELSDTVAAALQEILATGSPVEQTLKKFEDEYNAKYAGK